MRTRNKPRPATVFGIDIGKNLFHVVGLDAAGMPIQKATFRRDTLLQFFERAGPALVGMEACSGSQWLARKIAAMGHTVRIIPAQFVKPYVKSNKSDIIDAAAIAEAVTRPTMRFVEIRSPEHIDLQALHRVRDELSPKVGDGGNRKGGISWGCLTPPLLHRRSDMPCPKITSSS